MAAGISVRDHCCFLGGDAPDLTGVDLPEAGLGEDVGCTAAFAALGGCLDSAELGWLVRPTAWLRPPIVTCLGLNLSMSSALHIITDKHLSSVPEGAWSSRL